MSGVAVNIRAERRNRGWTLKDAADRFGVSVSGLSMIERGLFVPNAKVAFTIASAYDLKVTDVWPEPDEELAA